ncbi:GNAT family N-acetyltransferase [Martelella alba]|uniref:GNAT family N-acetyltransferase n=1 Tax=Martelella alba TaxID=2590451 RepID=A0ABY2SHL2_9HYPH|nr:GNAT family N-acetyltransferase [Martelella alba]TKI04597.1 GNAT family N-acetyltransferase [Martelella alba]
MQSEIATPTDAVAIAALINAAYRGGDHGHGWTHEAGLIAGDRTTPSAVASLIDDVAATVLLRRDDAFRPIGCITVTMNAPTRCTLSMLAVDPDCQSARMGRMLLEDAQRLAAGMGATVAKITVLEQREPLLAWYGRRGFQQTGDYEAFPYGINQWIAPLRDDLRFIVLEKDL